MVTLGAITWLISLRRANYLCCGLIVISVTACFAVDAATDPEGDGLWILGTLLVFIGMTIGTAVLTLLIATGRGVASRSRQAGGN